MGILDAPGLTPSTGDARYLPKWKASTPYAAGQAVLNPSGDLVTAKAAHTSGSSYTAANWTTPYVKRGDLVLNVQDYGAMGDGVTDDTSAIQSALNYAGPRGLTVFFPKPSAHYKITATLTIGFWIGCSVIGGGWETTEIRQYADNAPIFAFTKDNTHSWTFQGLRLTYANNQTLASHPRSYTFCRQNTDGVSSLSGNYHHAFRDLKIVGATYGFGVLRDQAGDTTSTNPWWGCEWTRVLFWNINRSCVDLSLGLVGAPCNRFSQCKVFQNSTYPNDGLGPAFNLRGEAIIDSMDVEQWRNNVISVTSANYITIRGLHVEHHYVTSSGGGNRLLYFANTTVDIEGLYVGYDDTSGFARYAIYADTNAVVRARGGFLNSPSNGASYLAMGNTTLGSSKISISGFNPSGFGGGVNLWSNGSVAISDITDVDGQPPVLQSSDTLPSAAATFRGRRYTQMGNGSTTADQQVVCLMSATGSYSWKTLVSG